MMLSRGGSCISVPVVNSSTYNGQYDMHGPTINTHEIVPGLSSYR